MNEVLAMLSDTLLDVSGAVDDARYHRNSPADMESATAALVQAAEQAELLYSLLITAREMAKAELRKGVRVPA